MMKTKPVLFITVTFVIGFVLGMLTSAQIRFNRLKPFRMYSSEERFREGFYKTIQPDEKQKAEIEQILNKYAKININMQTDIRKEIDSNLKEMRKELDSKLSKEQIARLKEMDERWQQMIRQHMKDRKDSIGRPNMRQGGPQGNSFHPAGRPMPPSDRPPFPQDDTSRVIR